MSLQRDGGRWKIEKGVEEDNSASISTVKIDPFL